MPKQKQNKNRIFVSNFRFDTTKEELTEFFAQYGDVEEVQIMTDKDTGKSRGFGFVDLGNQTQAESAILQCDQREYRGRVLNVALAREREKRDDNIRHRSN